MEEIEVPTEHLHETIEEEVEDAVKKNGGKNWKKIAEALPGRTDV